MTKRITISLNTSSIDNAIRELQEYKKEIVHKSKLLEEKIAKRIRDKAQSGFNNSVASDTTDGNVMAQVQVSVQPGEHTIVIASGEDAVFVEFGAGVYHNTPVGTSPHPKGNELKLTIGSYGKGKGKRQSWGYYEDGKLYITHGAPATMPMYRALQETCDDISQIIREVFW